MKRLFNNTVFTTIDSVVVIALSLLATPILIRYLGTTGYGIYVFLSIFSFYGVLSVFDFGMGGSVVTYVARAEAEDDRSTIQKLLCIGVVYYGCIGTVLGLALYLGTNVIISRFVGDLDSAGLESVKRAVAIISINVTVQFVILALNSTLEGLRQYIISKSVNSILLVPQYVGLIIVAALTQRLDLAFAVILTVNVAKLIVLAVMMMVKLPYFRNMHFGFDLVLFKCLFSYSSVLFISRIIGVIFNQIDKVLIWAYLAVASLTIYDVVVRPANMVRLIMTVLNSAIVPETSRLHRLGDYAMLRKLYINLVRYAYLIILPIAAFIGVHITDLLTLWVGADLARYSWMVLILLSSYALSPISSVASTMVVGLEMVKKTIWISIVGTIINATLSIMLVTRFGVPGLLLATLSAQVFMVGPYLYQMMRILNMPLMYMIRPVTRLLISAVPFVAMHLAVRQLCGGNVPVLMFSGGVIVLVNCLINYRFQLDVSERAYLLERLRTYRNRLVPGASIQ